MLKSREPPVCVCVCERERERERERESEREGERVSEWVSECVCVGERERERERESEREREREREWVSKCVCVGERERERVSVWALHYRHSVHGPGAKMRVTGRVCRNDLWDSGTFFFIFFKLSCFKCERITGRVLARGLARFRSFDVNWKRCSDVTLTLVTWLAV